MSEKRIALEHSLYEAEALLQMGGRTDLVGRQLRVVFAAMRELNKETEQRLTKIETEMQQLRGAR